MSADGQIFTSTIICFSLFWHSTSKAITLDEAMQGITENIEFPPVDRLKRQVLNYSQLSFAAKWPQARVHYEIEKSAYNETQKQIIRLAMDEIENSSCVRFIERTGDEYFLRILPFTQNGRQEDGICQSILGYAKFPQWSITNQSLFLGADCFEKVLIVHELMHALGFIHEQQRPDRDIYIEISFSNILESLKSQFAKMITYTSIIDLYDYNSIMHYPDRLGAIDPNKPTMVARNGRQLAGATGLSKQDIFRINEWYNCSEQPSVASAIVESATETATMTPLLLNSTVFDSAVDAITYLNASNSTQTATMTTSTNKSFLTSAATSTAANTETFSNATNTTTAETATTPLFLTSAAFANTIEVTTSSNAATASDTVVTPAASNLTLTLTVTKNTSDAVQTSTTDSTNDK